jgi:hypothetical protein
MQAKLVRLLPYLTKVSNKNAKLEKMDQRDLLSHVNQQKTLIEDLKGEIQELKLIN